MRKWLMAIVVVLAGFMVILLLLGYLLNENEKSTTVLKTQLEQESQAEQQRQEKIRQRKILTYSSQPSVTPKTQDKMIASTNKAVVDQFTQIVINNLTCISKQQCQVALVSFKNSTCSVAINHIGASLLKKLNTKSSVISACPKAMEQANLSCQQNICTFEH